MKTLQFDLGVIRPLQAGVQEYSAGWYVDPRTGMPIYYDPDTRNFYTMSGGVYLPLMSLSTPPKQVAVAPGDNLRITVSFKYTGPAISGANIRYCIGPNGIFGFTEQMVAVESFNIPAGDDASGIGQRHQLAHLRHTHQRGHRTGSACT